MMSLTLRLILMAVLLASCASAESFASSITGFATGPSGAAFAGTGAVLLTAPDTISSHNLPPLQISDNRRFLATGDGRPFFWLGDTAWRITRIRPDDVDHYLSRRASQGFTVIQIHCGHSKTADEAEVDFAGNTPFVRLDPARPNEVYWRNIDSIVEKAGDRGLYVVLFPLWGGEFGRAFGRDQQAAYRYGRWLAGRYGRYSHVVWAVSGEYSEINNFKLPIEDSQRELFNASARGLREALPEGRLLTIHPGGQQSSSRDFHDQPWLAFNMIQSGHFMDSHAYGSPENYDLVAADYSRSPTKPVVDGEPMYEDTPDAVWKVQHVNGPRAGADTMRRKAYWAVFAGAFGHTYGHNDVYCFFKPRMRGEVRNLKTKPSGPGQRGSWRDALEARGARQMVHLRNLMESRPFFSRIPDQSLILGDAGSGLEHVAATRDSGGSYAMVYLPRARRITVGLGNLKGTRISAWWFNPRNGKATKSGCFDRSEQREFSPPREGDWVLVIDEGCHASAPGKTRKRPAAHHGGQTGPGLAGKVMGLGVAGELAAGLVRKVAAAGMSPPAQRRSERPAAGSQLCNLSAIFQHPW